MFKSEHGPNVSCYSACHRKNGDLLLGYADGISLFEQANQTVTSIKTICNVFAVEHGRNIFMVHQVDQMRNVYVCLSDDSTNKQKLIGFPQPAKQPSHIAVSERCVAVTNNTGMIVLYEFATKKSTNLYPQDASQALHFLPNEDLLSTNTDKSRLTRYRLENRQMSKVWACEGLTGCYGVCSDSNGLIYVCSRRNRAVYIISPDGKFTD